MTSVSRINIVQEIIVINMLHGIQGVYSTKEGRGGVAPEVEGAIGVVGGSLPGRHIFGHCEGILA